MIPRYSMPEMATLFDDQSRLGRWLQVEVLAVQAMASLGIVSNETSEFVSKKSIDLLQDAPKDFQWSKATNPKVKKHILEAVLEREKITNHDLAAFVDIVQDQIGSYHSEFIHYGLTSSDIVDTASSATLVQSADLLIQASEQLVAVLKAKALEHKDTPMVGRTHGMHAEPTTFGVKLALWALQADRDLKRLKAAREAIAVGKLSGAVGTYSNIDPAIEDYVCLSLGLKPVPSTQVIARDRHAEYIWACASVGASVESFATEIRHLQRSEVAEVQEAFGKGQKGSSAMPHKRNPITSEKLSGLARLLRGYLGAALEDVALWHERDISHSSVERVIFPDASLLGYYVLKQASKLIENLVVKPDKMLKNLELSNGMVFSQSILLSLVASGLPRDQAYRIVQRNAVLAYQESRNLKDVISQDPEVKLSPQAIEEAFDLKRMFRNIDRIFNSLKEIG